MVNHHIGNFWGPIWVILKTEDSKFTSSVVIVNSRRFRVLGYPMYWSFFPICRLSQHVMTSIKHQSIPYIPYYLPLTHYLLVRSPFSHIFFSHIPMFSPYFIGSSVQIPASQGFKTTLRRAKLEVQPLILRPGNWLDGLEVGCRILYDAIYDYGLSYMIWWNDIYIYILYPIKYYIILYHMIIWYMRVYDDIYVYIYILFLY